MLVRVDRPLLNLVFEGCGIGLLEERLAGRVLEFDCLTTPYREANSHEQPPKQGAAGHEALSDDGDQIQQGLRRGDLAW